MMNYYYKISEFKLRNNKFCLGVNNEISIYFILFDLHLI